MTNPAANKLLDPEVIQRAEHLGLQARSIVEGYMAGEHKSPYRGFAIEFAQHREYVPGDDPRHLDWKVLGRSDRYVVKQYEQETNFVAHILLDGSKSMAYGSGAVTKFHFGRVMAACLAYLILQQRDAMALAIFDSSIRQYLPRADNLSSIHAAVAALAAFEPVDRTGIGNVLRDMAHKARRRGIFIIISDFFDDEERILEGIRHLRFAGNEVILFQVLDPYELSFPFNGNVEFESLEGGERMLTKPAEIRKSYLAELGSFLERLKEGCVQAGCHYIRLDTSQPWAEVLSGYLVTRRHRYG